MFRYMVWTCLVTLTACSLKSGGERGTASRNRGGAEWKLQPDIVLMNPVCASHPCLNINIKAKRLGFTCIPRGNKHAANLRTQLRKRPVVPTCVQKALIPLPWYSLGFFSAKKSSPDRFRHTGFLLQPQRHMERPCIYHRRGLPDEIVLIYYWAWCACVRDMGLETEGCDYAYVINKEAGAGRVPSKIVPSQEFVNIPTL